MVTQHYLFLFLACDNRLILSTVNGIVSGWLLRGCSGLSHVRAQIGGERGWKRGTESVESGQGTRSGSTIGSIGLSWRRNCREIAGKRETGHVRRECTWRRKNERCSGRSRGHGEVRVHSCRGSGRLRLLYHLLDSASSVSTSTAPASSSFLFPIPCSSVLEPDLYGMESRHTV